jgi:hypothetical protein
LGFGLQTLREEEGGAPADLTLRSAAAAASHPQFSSSDPLLFSLAKLPSPPFFGHLIFSLLQEEEEEEGNIRS